MKLSNLAILAAGLAGIPSVNSQEFGSPQFYPDENLVENRIVDPGPYSQFYDDIDYADQSWRRAVDNLEPAGNVPGYNWWTQPPTRRYSPW